MRRGYNAALVFDVAGHLVAIATGSDACTEHECGSKSLMSALCEQLNVDGAVVAALKAGRSVLYPDLLQSKMITRQVTQVQFREIKSDPPQALLGFAQNPLERYVDDLQFLSLESDIRDNTVVGAWGENCFAIRVRGEAYVAALREFHAALLNKQVAFAGTFFKRSSQSLSGVILADTRYLSDADRSEIAEAQKKHESNLRLKARDESDRISGELNRLSGKRYSGYLWAVWKDREESDVLYALNPGYQVRAQYYGPYTKEELRAWAEAQCAYDLKPTPRAA
jgi:hypothetical protein